MPQVILVEYDPRVKYANLKNLAKVLQKMHIRKKIEQKFTFKLGFLAYGLHSATVASGELAKPRRRPKVLQAA